MSQNLLLSPSCVVRIRYKSSPCANVYFYTFDGLLPSSSSQPTLLIVTPGNSNPVMTNVTKNISSNSFGYVSPKASTPETTCNICKRLLYSFEEILVCRICYGSYHWRCVKPETISQSGVNENYVCDNCNDSTRTNSSRRLSNGSNRNKSIESFDANFNGIPSRTNLINTSRHFEDKQQSPPYKTTKVSDLDDYLPSETNENEHDYHNSQYNDDSRTPRRLQQQQQVEIRSDDENETSAMFQADYQYTPLTEYAAARSGRTTNDNNTNNYQNSPSDSSDRQPSSRYGGGLHYMNHGFDPTVSRLVEVPSLATTNFTSPTVDNLSLHNREHHFTTTTNLNINEKPSRHPQQQTSLNHSTSYLSQNHDNNSPVLKSSPQRQQQQTDRRSTVGSDSGIVIVNSNPQQQQEEQQHSNENHIVEKKLTNLVQQLGKQLENDAQKLNEKLEIKLKDLEKMIHQQTYVIRGQDEVIERLKGKILQIETERDHFRQRLSVHEQREQDEKKKFTINETDKFYKQDKIIEQDNQSNRKYSNTSTIITDNNKPPKKKPPAPRVEQQWSTTKDEHEHEHQPTIAKLVKNISTNRERLASDSSSAPSITGKLVSSVPLIETPAASSRLDNMIHQSNTKDISNPSSSSYSLAQVRRQDRPQILEPVSSEQIQIVTSVHHDDSEDINNNKNVFNQKRSSSSSSSSSSASSLPTQPAKTLTTTSTNNLTTAPATTLNRNSNKYQSFESLQHTNQSDQGLKLTNKTASLQFGTKPLQDDDPGSIYITPVESNRPAIQSNSPAKGWLRKQNRDSYLKRIERYYCVLTNNALLMHRHDHDRTPHKAIHLKGAKVVYYDDSKYGPSLELTWSNRSNEIKHYHLYAPNPQEAEKWISGLRATISSLENKNKWQRYRMNT